VLPANSTSHRERFDEFGINLTVLRPQQPMTMYHRERYQERFLVLRGECADALTLSRVTFPNTGAPERPCAAADVGVADTLKASRAST
jgi:hypothetical protein